MNFLQKNWKGILVCLVMAVPCWLLGQKFPIVGGPVFGILAGMIVTLLWRDKTAAQPGISDFIDIYQSFKICIFQFFYVSEGLSYFLCYSFTDKADTQGEQSSLKRHFPTLGNTLDDIFRRFISHTVQVLDIVYSQLVQICRILNEP